MPATDTLRAQIITDFENSHSYFFTIFTAKKASEISIDEWTAEEVDSLFRIGYENKQVRDCISYRFSDNDTADFYRALMDHYTGDLLSDENAYHIKELLSILNGNEVKDFLAECRAQNPRSEGLYHANSVRTSLSYLDLGYLYPRSRGAGEQTAQASDEMDRELMIYDDIFFDNIDIAQICNGSVYGPIMFVFDDDILDDAEIRITKTNPYSGNGWDHARSEEAMLRITTYCGRISLPFRS